MTLLPSRPEPLSLSRIRWFISAMIIPQVHCELVGFFDMIKHIRLMIKAILDLSQKIKLLMGKMLVKKGLM